MKIYERKKKKIQPNSVLRSELWIKQTKTTNPRKHTKGLTTQTAILCHKLKVSSLLTDRVPYGAGKGGKVLF